MRIEERYNRVIEYFRETMPSPETELDYGSPFQLLVAVILSAQCTDKRVNLITPALFKKYPDPGSMSAAGMDRIFELIKSCSYPNSKAKYLADMSLMVARDFNGTIPESLEDLQKLPGVGRKTANVIASVVFKMPVMPVDTHVLRVSVRLGLAKKGSNPLKAENSLMKYLPAEVVADAHHWLILHGRYICKAQNPSCSKCGLTEICLFYSNQKPVKSRM